MVTGKYLQNYTSTGSLQLLLQQLRVLAHLSSIHLPAHWSKEFLK